MLSTIIVILSTICLLSFFHISVYALLQRVIIGNTKEKGQVLGASLLKLQRWHKEIRNKKIEKEVRTTYM